MMLSIWYWFCRFGAFLVLDIRLYYLWSRLGRWLFERQYLDKPIRSYSSFTQLQNTVSKWIWRPDPFWQAFDLISHPAAFEARAQNQNERDDGDCDDFSVYLGVAMEELRRRDEFVAGVLVSRICLLSVPWVGFDGKPGGHNVCAFRYQDQRGDWAWAWVSNWYDCKIVWTKEDGQRYRSPGAIVSHMCELVQARNTRWALASLDLKEIIATGSQG